MEDVKIYSTSDKSLAAKFINEHYNKDYYMNQFITDVVYNSFSRDWDYKIVYTIVMVKYKEIPLENTTVMNWTSITTTSTEDFSTTVNYDATEIWGEGELSTTTE